jgi:hypothetical protein
MKKTLSLLILCFGISLASFAQVGTAVGKIKSANPVDAAAANAKPVVETSENGTVNYTQQYIEAVGSSIIDTTRFKNKAQATAMARRGAVVDAQRNLLEIIKGVNVQGETTVQDLITTSDKVVTKVEGVIKGAQMVGKPRILDGEIEVTMRIPLYATNGLGGAIINDLPEVPAGATAPDTAKNLDALVTGISTMSVKSDEASNTTASADVANLNNTDKPFALRVAGKFVPSMFPVIVDDKGNVLLDSKKLYDPSKGGKFPKILQTRKNVAEQIGFKKGVEVLDVIQDAATGNFKLMDSTKAKVNWKKIGQVAGKIGKFLLMLI